MSCQEPECHFQRVYGDIVRNCSDCFVLMDSVDVCAWTYQPQIKKALEVECEIKMVNRSFIRYYHVFFKRKELNFLLFTMDEAKSEVTILSTRKEGEKIVAESIHRFSCGLSEELFTEKIADLIQRKLQMLGFDFSQSENENDFIVRRVKELKEILLRTTEPVEYATVGGDFVIEITYEEFKHAIQDILNRTHSSIWAVCEALRCDIDLIVLNENVRKIPLIQKMFTEVFPEYLYQVRILYFDPERDYTIDEEETDGLVASIEKKLCEIRDMEMR